MNALIIFSYATIKSLDDIESFYTHLSHGRPSQTMIDRGYQLFRSIGTCDPLAATTKRIGQALINRLQTETKTEWKFYVGGKHTYPFI